jgi:hypothetical protein
MCVTPRAIFELIGKNRITAEEDLMKPKSSNEMFTTVWDDMRKTVPRICVW